MPARPDLWRFNILRRLLWPSTGPVLPCNVTPAFTASSSARHPLAKLVKAWRPLAVARLSQVSR